MKTTKKLLSVLLSVLMILSTVSCLGMVSFAENTEDCYEETIILPEEKRNISQNGFSLFSNDKFNMDYNAWQLWNSNGNYTVVTLSEGIKLIDITVYTADNKNLDKIGLGSNPTFSAYEVEHKVNEDEKYVVLSADRYNDSNSFFIGMTDTSYVNMEKITFRYTHRLSDTYNYDATNHWQTCKYENCDKLHNSLAEHTYSKGACVCGKPCEHKYSELDFIWNDEGTGIDVLDGTCIVCGLFEFFDVDDVTITEKIVTAPTHTEKGEMTYYASIVKGGTEFGSESEKLFPVEKADHHTYISYICPCGAEDLDGAKAYVLKEVESKKAEAKSAAAKNISTSSISDAESVNDVMLAMASIFGAINRLETELEEAKNFAVNTVKAMVNGELTDGMKAVLANAEAEINAADSPDSVQEAKASAITAIQKQTEKDEEDRILALAKAEALEEIGNAKNSAVSDDAKAISVADITNAATADELDAAKAGVLAAITAADEKFVEVKASALSAVNAAKTDKNSDIADKAAADIESATSTAVINTISTQALTKMAAITAKYTEISEEISFVDSKTAESEHFTLSTDKVDGDGWFAGNGHQIVIKPKNENIVITGIDAKVGYWGSHNKDIEYSSGEKVEKDTVDVGSVVHVINIYDRELTIYNAGIYCMLYKDITVHYVITAPHDHDFTGEYRNNLDGTHSRNCIFCYDYSEPVQHTYDGSNICACGADKDVVNAIAQAISEINNAKTDANSAIAEKAVEDIKVAVSVNDVNSIRTKALSDMAKADAAAAKELADAKLDAIIDINNAMTDANAEIGKKALADIEAAKTAAAVRTIKSKALEDMRDADREASLKAAKEKATAELTAAAEAAGDKPMVKKTLENALYNIENFDFAYDWDVEYYTAIVVKELGYIALAPADAPAGISFDEMDCSTDPDEMHFYSFGIIVEDEDIMYVPGYVYDTYLNDIFITPVPAICFTDGYAQGWYITDDESVWPCDGHVTAEEKALAEAKAAAIAEIKAVLTTDSTDAEKALINEAVNTISNAVSVNAVEEAKADFYTKWKELHTQEDPTEPDQPSKTCNHMCHKKGFLGFIWKITRFFCKLFGTNKTCSCGVAHY